MSFLSLQPADFPSYNKIFCFLFSFGQFSHNFSVYLGRLLIKVLSLGKWWLTLHLHTDEWQMKCAWKVVSAPKTSRPAPMLLVTDSPSVPIPSTKKYSVWMTVVSDRSRISHRCAPGIRCSDREVKQLYSLWLSTYLFRFFFQFITDVSLERNI